MKDNDTNERVKQCKHISKRGINAEQEAEDEPNIVTLNTSFEKYKPLEISKKDKEKIKKFEEYVLKQNSEATKNIINLNDKMYEMLNNLDMSRIIEVDSEDA